MDTIIRFVNIIAWIGAICFGLLSSLGFLSAVAYYYPGNRVRLLEEARGVQREFRWPSRLLIALICAAWIYAAGAY